MSSNFVLRQDELEVWDKFAASAAVISCSFSEAASFADALILERRRRQGEVVSQSLVGQPCSKCGEKNVIVRFKAGLDAHSVSSPCWTQRDEHTNEHHHVACTRCSAVWVESVLRRDKTS